MYQNLFFYFPVEGHLGYFQFRAIMNYGAKEHFCICLLWIYDFIYLGSPGMELPGYRMDIDLFSIYKIKAQ